jgi:hypothetical protein
MSERDCVRLKDAGIREQEWAQHLVAEKFVAVTFEDFLNYGMYDPSRDEVFITIKAVVLRFRVARP